MNIYQIHEFLMTQITLEQHAAIVGGWCNGFSCEQVAKGCKAPIEVVRGFYFYRDLGFREANENTWFSQWEAQANG